jgi:hypothetical protein
VWGIKRTSSVCKRNSFEVELEGLNVKLLAQHVLAGVLPCTGHPDQAFVLQSFKATDLCLSQSSELIYTRHKPNSARIGDHGAQRGKIEPAHAVGTNTGVRVADSAELIQSPDNLILDLRFDSRVSVYPGDWAVELKWKSHHVDVAVPEFLTLL